MLWTGGRFRLSPEDRQSPDVVDHPRRKPRSEERDVNWVLPECIIRHWRKALSVRCIDTGGTRARSIPIRCRRSFRPTGRVPLTCQRESVLASAPVPPAFYRPHRSVRHRSGCETTRVAPVLLLLPGADCSASSGSSTCNRVCTSDRRREYSRMRRCILKAGKIGFAWGPVRGGTT